LLREYMTRDSEKSSSVELSAYFDGDRPSLLIAFSHAFFFSASDQRLFE
jgi:hypothetical protein